LSLQVYRDQLSISLNFIKFERQTCLRK